MRNSLNGSDVTRLLCVPLRRIILIQGRLYLLRAVSIDARIIDTIVHGLKSLAIVQVAKHFILACIALLKLTFSCNLISTRNCNSNSINVFKFMSLLFDEFIIIRINN